MTMMVVSLSYFTAVAILVLQWPCCSCNVLDANALPNQLRSRAGGSSSSVLASTVRRRGHRRTEIDTISLDGFFGEDEDDGAGGQETVVTTIETTEEFVDEIVDLLQTNVQMQRDAVEEREPTDYPTGIPETDEPTAFPTSSVDSKPSSTPTDEPTNELTAKGDEEDSGTGSNGNSSTTVPSFVANDDASPAMSPNITDTNSHINNNATAILADALATAGPTEANFAAPSATPITSSPTPSPSFSPTTASPTFSPTPACHDKRSYRSPINGLGCEQHVGSDCEKWRHIGLTEAQVVELHHECPVACRTDCEQYTMSPSAAPSASPTASPTKSLKDVVAFLEIYMYGAPGPMTIETRQTLEETLQLYFEEKLDASDTTGSSNMASVAIADQGAIGGTSEAPAIVGAERSNKLRKRRRLADEKLNLKVKIIAEATTRHLDSAMFKALLHGAINTSEALTSVLLVADDYFSGVMISNDMIGELNRAKGEETKPGSKPPTAAIVVSSIGVIAIGGFLTGHYFFRRHYGDRKVRKNIQAFFNFSPKDGYISDEEGGHRPDLSYLKRVGSIFSFEESPVHCLPGNAASIKAPGLLGSRSQSTASGSESNASLPMKMTGDQAIIVSPPNSPENLMAGIPPMIVIDNIDQAEDADGSDNEGGEGNGVPPPLTTSQPKSRSPRRKSNLPKAKKNGMPIRRIEASSAIAKALSNGNREDSEISNDKKELTLMEMIRNVKSIEDDDEDDARSPTSSSRQCISPTFDRVWNDGDSVSSLPDVAAVNTNLDQTRLQKSHSTDEVNDVEPSKALNAFIQNEWANLGLSPTNSQLVDQDDRSDGSVGSTYHQNLFASDSDVESGTASAELSRELPRKDNKLKTFVSSLTQLSNHSRDSSKLSESPSLSPKKRGLEAVDEIIQRSTDRSIASSDYGSEARDTFDYEARPGLFSVSMARFERKMSKIGQKYQSKKDDAWKNNTGIASGENGHGTTSQRAMVRQISDSSRDSANSSSESQQDNTASFAPHSPVRCFTDVKPTTSFSPKVPPAAIIASQSRTSNLRRSRNVAGGFEYLFEAPSNGKLGIIIHKTVVHTVKDYSPLFGMVEPGDKILQIDDIITNNMSTGEVTRVLAEKRTGKNRNKMIRLTILSTTEKKGLKTSDEESIVAPAAFERKPKQVTINEDAPVSTFIYTNRTGSSEEDEADDSSHLTSEQSTPQHDETGDAGFHLLGACARSEDEEDEDAAFHLLGSMYSSGTSGEEEETPDNPGMNLEAKKSGGKEEEEEEDRAFKDTVMGGESDHRNDAEESSVGDPEEDNSFNHMIIIDAGSDESEGSSVDFEDFL